MDAATSAASGDEPSHFCTQNCDKSCVKVSITLLMALTLPRTINGNPENMECWNDAQLIVQVNYDIQGHMRGTM